jgi:uncharacterized protein YuzB (UPF0349 family)
VAVHIVNVCSSNELASCTELELLNQLSNKFKVIVKDCLGNCGQCYLEKFAKVEGRFITFNEGVEVLEQLENELQDKENE